MDENNKQGKKSVNLKTKLFIAVIILLVLVSGLFYLFYKTTETNRIRYEQGEVTIKLVGSEYQRCNDLLSQDGGNFADYEYCRKFNSVFQSENDKEIN